MLDSSWIKKSVKDGLYFFSKHGDSERQNDNLSIEEVEEAILSSIIIEQYDNTGRGESCLLAGYTSFGKPIHIVCRKRGDELVIITVYIPKPPKFKSIYERI
jgi:hypothetical protein